MRSNINGYTFDSASNESVINGLVKLDDYVIVDWILGEEGAATSSFDEKENISAGLHYKWGSSFCFRIRDWL